MKILYLILSIILLSTNIFAEEIDVSKLPKLLGSGNMGREFYFTFILGWRVDNEDLKLFISSSVRTKVTVSIPGKHYEQIKYTIPNEIIEFSLHPDYGQAYNHHPIFQPETDAVWKGVGVHVVSDDPIICYGVTKFFSSDGFLALPVNLLGKEYIISTYPDPADNIERWYPAFTGVTAAYDKTRVFFTMGGNNGSQTTGGLKPGECRNYDLNAGDVLLIASSGKGSDLTGSKIESNKPISVVSGNFCATIPFEKGYCGVTEEMELPTHAWGLTYHITPIINSGENPRLKIFAKEPNTTIYRNNQQIGVIKNAGGIEGYGWFEIISDTGSSKPVVISSDKPIGITQFYSDEQAGNPDPFQMVLIPAEQYNNEITFCTPGLGNGGGFQSNYINLVYEANKKDSIPDDLEFAEFVAGNFNWQKLKDISPTPGRPFFKLNTTKNYYHKTFVLPGDGVYKFKADKPFQAYSYGFSDYNSYGYPASAGLKDLSKPDTIAPNPPWKMNNFGNVNDPNDPSTGMKEVIDLPEDPTFRSNLSSIYMHSEQSFNYELLVSQFIPCEDQKASWILYCKDNGKDARAVITFTDCAGNDTTLFIDYFAPNIELEPKEWDFVGQGIDQVSEKIFYLINYHQLQPWYCGELKLKNKISGFSLWNLDGITPLGISEQNPIIIQPLDTFKFIVRFETAKHGEFWDSIGFGDTCCIFYYKSYLEAKVGTPKIQVSDCNFQPIEIGKNIYCTFYVMNIGRVTLEIYAFGGPFEIGKKNGKPIYGFPLFGLPEEKFPMILKPNELRNFHISFSPDDTLFYPDSIIFISNSIKTDTLGNIPDSVCILFGQGIKTTNVEDNVQEGIRIYPNPASDFIEIKSQLSPKEIDGIKIYNHLGQSVGVRVHSNEPLRLDVSHLPNGIYFLRIISDENWHYVTRILIKQ